jgi:O-antigen ligase
VDEQYTSRAELSLSEMPDERSLRPWQPLFRFSISSLPYLYYLSLTGLFAVLIALIAKFRRTALDPLTRNGLLIVSALLVLSSICADHKGEACLQLVHFLPFFLLFAFLPYVLRGGERLERVAIVLVISTIPINILSLFEYLLKSIDFPRSMRRNPIAVWVRETPDRGRAIVMFDHPNAFASYLVIVLGLGLGLILKHAYERSAQVTSAAIVDRRIRFPDWLIYLGTFINLVGIFSSGSRNGFLVAVSQLVVFSLCIRASRAIFLTGITSLAAIVAGAAVLGIGGRALSVSRWWAEDPRVALWQIALNFMGDRPWLGWGLGSFKLLYPPHQISKWYPEVYHPHNFWLLLGSETGILVTIALTTLISYICFRTARRMRQLEPSYRAILLGYCLAFWSCVAFALFDVTFYDARINALNWTILAAIYAAGQKSSWNTR